MDVLWNGTVVRSETVVHDPARTATNMLWTYSEIVVTAASTITVLKFQSTTVAMNGAQGVAPFHGPALDDVSVVNIGGCGTADFNCDGDLGTDADIAAFFACISGSCPGAPCPSTADFNGDGDLGTDADIEGFFRVLSGGSC